jgi:hypothetical protein
MERNMPLSHFQICLKRKINAGSGLDSVVTLRFLKGFLEPDLFDSKSSIAEVFNGRVVHRNLYQQPHQATIKLIKFMLCRQIRVPKSALTDI